MIDSTPSSSQLEGPSGPSGSSGPSDIPLVAVSQSCGPPPAYSPTGSQKSWKSSGSFDSTSSEVEHKSYYSWPPGQSFPFEPLPPYPAGPNLSKVKYPRDVSGPRYECPHCEQQFLFHRLSGIVVCPFCQSTISVGNYNQHRSRVFLSAGGLSFLAAVVILLLYVCLFREQSYFVIVVCLLVCASIMFLIKAAHSRHHYRESTLIDQS